MTIDLSNPYAANEYPHDSATEMVVDSSHAAMFKQLKVIAILQLMEGIFEIILGGILITVAFFVVDALTNQPPPGAKPLPAEMMQFMRVMYVVFGGLTATAGLLRIVSAIGCIWLRWRNWTIFSLFFGLITVFTGLCALFSAGLCIYGLVVMFNPGVERAFQLARNGYSRDQIKRLFAGAEAQ